MSTPTDLIDAGDIAALLKRSREHVVDRIVKRPGFPRPAIDLSQKTRFWDRDEVMAFLKTRRKPGRPRQS